MRNNFWHGFVLAVSLGVALSASAQPDTLRDGFVQFRYASGHVSSEGFMRAGQPDGYWKTYYENGVLKSEGNRKNYQLDSLWKFYNDSSRLLLSITYRQGKKNGLKTTYRPGETTSETFVDDILEGPASFYYPTGQLRLTIQFVHGLEEGKCIEQDTAGRPIAFLEYKKGFLINREQINRIDSQGRKQGRWKFFFPDWKIQSEGTYRDDKKYGYFKTYGTDGNLLTVQKFINDVEQPEAPEVTQLKLKTDYYPSGRVKTVGSYNGNVAEGIRREYAENGNITAAYVFTHGAMTGEGIVDEEGDKQGAWKEYYTDGTLRSVGSYKDNKPVGPWKYFYENGQVESAGKYTDKGQPDGDWAWYFDNGSLRRDQGFIGGVEDGPYAEYDEAGKLIVKGNYVEGLEEGEWVTDFGYYRETGSYTGGARTGRWKSYYSDGTLRFDGGYLDDNLNGTVYWYWPSGKLKDRAQYLNGSREGDWTVYSEDGTPFLVITYRGDVEKRYDGVLIKPPFEE